MTAVDTAGRKWICAKCQAELQMQKKVFNYLGHTFSHDVPACPKCCKVFIPQELAQGRMAQVEEQLEDK